MKKILRIVSAFFVTLALCTTGVQAEATATKAKPVAAVTDVAVFIDGLPIKSYDILGKTYVQAWDLPYYGFYVKRNGGITSIQWTDKPERVPLPKDDINIMRSKVEEGKKLFDVTADTVSLGGDNAPAYSVGDDVTLVDVSLFDRFGWVFVDEEKREIRIEILRCELSKAFDAAKKQELDMTTKDTPKNMRIKYEGEVKDKKPNGIGKLTTTWGEKDAEMVEIGYFKDGKKDGRSYKSGTVPFYYGDTLAGVTYIEEYGSYTNDEQDGLFVTVGQDNISGTYIRNAINYKNGQMHGLAQRGQPDDAYFYSFYVLDEQIYDLSREIQSKIQPGVKFKETWINDFDAFALTEDNKLYMWSGDNSTDPKLIAPFYTRYNVKSAFRQTIGDYPMPSPFVLAQDNKLYIMNELLVDKNDTLMLDNVVAASPYFYLDNKGQLFTGTWNKSGRSFTMLSNNVASFSGVLSPVLIKNDSSLWVPERHSMFYSFIQYNQQSAVTQDSLRFYKVADNCISAYINLMRVIFVKRDKTVWAFDNVLNSSNYVKEFAGQAAQAPVKIADGFIEAKCGYDFAAARKEDNSLWVWGSNNGNALGYQGLSTLTPRKIADDVISFDCTALGGLFVKSDGTLWGFGSSPLTVGLLPSEAAALSQAELTALPRQLYAHELR